MDERVLAIDFAHESLTAALVARDGRVESQADFELGEFARSGAPDKIMERLILTLTDLARQSPVPANRVFMSMACELDRDRTRVLKHHQANWLNGQLLPGRLSAALGLPVAMERRGVVLLTCDRVMLALPEDAIIVGCYIDNHFDNAIWVRGGPLFGRNGFAGDIAHMTIHGREDACACGKAGCVDLYGAGTRLRQIQSMIFPDSPLEEIFSKNGEHPIIRDFLSIMAYPIAVEARILDPDFVVIGGEIPALSDFPRRELEEAIRGHLHVTGGRPPTFMASVTDAATGVVCAGRYAFMGK